MQHDGLTGLNVYDVRMYVYVIRLRDGDAKEKCPSWMDNKVLFYSIEYVSPYLHFVSQQDD
jgi:hypothetical protein